MQDLTEKLGISSAVSKSSPCFRALPSIRILPLNLFQNNIDTEDIRSISCHEPGKACYVTGIHQCLAIVPSPAPRMKCTNTVVVQHSIVVTTPLTSNCSVRNTKSSAKPSFCTHLPVPRSRILQDYILQYILRDRSRCSSAHVPASRGV